MLATQYDAVRPHKIGIAALLALNFVRWSVICGSFVGARLKDELNTSDIKEMTTYLIFLCFPY